MGEMKVMTQAGDITVSWDPDDADSVEKAKAEWDRLKKDGYEFYEVTESKGKRLKSFSKNKGKVIAAPGVKKAADKKAGTRRKANAGGPNAQTNWGAAPGAMVRARALETELDRCGLGRLGRV